MPATAPDYDAMDDLTEEASAEDTDEDIAAEAGAGLDAELLMHAEAAGLDATKAEALKDFVDRCAALRDQGVYEAEDADTAEDDTESDE